MIINHNMGALNANRQMGINQTNANKSMEKLSSGLKINRAGDDAAGLAISEKMRGQIRGLDKAAANAQDGISLIQTAEGALNETHSILQRMRELSVQASNDTNVGTDRNEIQKELNQLNSEIDRISNTTEFNTQKLLNGSLGAAGTSSNDTIVSVNSVSGLKAGSYTVKIDTAASNAKTTASTADYVGDTEAEAVKNKDISINGVKIDTSGIASKDDLLAALNKDSDTTGFTASFDGANKIVFEANEEGTGKSLTISGVDASAVNGGTLVDGTDAKVTITGPDETNVITGTGNKVVYGNGEFNVKGAAAETATITVSTSGASIHIGANKDQNMLVDINEMSTKTLGNDTDKIKDINVLTAGGAEKAITTVDDAIKQVSAERSKLGAFQNRLEHTINNLGTSSENLTSAESRIRDVDMAKEMSQFSKNNILSQAAQAMLAQANNQPQQILQLLK